MNIIKHRKIYYIISGTLILASISSIIVWRLNLGMDFKGGSLIEIQFQDQRPNTAKIKESLKDLNLGDINVQPTGSKGVILRTKDLDETTHQIVLEKIKNLGKFEEKRFDSIGPVIGEELKYRAFYAIAAVLVMIVIYIAWAFRKVSRPIASWKYGICALIALFHDTFIPTGVFVVLGHFKGMEIDLLFVTGLLTVLGFSVHDTIVVFDRIRENLKKGAGHNFEDTVNLSVKQTFIRSINTSLTVFLTLLAIYIFGGETIKNFALLLMIGILFGTYSSIFIASPLLVSWENYRQKKFRR